MTRYDLKYNSYDFPVFYTDWSDVTNHLLSPLLAIYGINGSFIIKIIFIIFFPLGKVHRIVLETVLYICYCSNKFSSSFYFIIYTQTCPTMLVPHPENISGKVHRISLETYIWCV